MAPTAHAQAPAVAVNPMTGVAGTALTVTGSGWSAGDPVAVDIDGQLVCQLTADSGGSLNGSQAGNGCQVPAGPIAGSHEVTATDLSNSDQANVPDFKIPVAASFTAQSPVAIGEPVDFTSTSTVFSGSSPSTYFWEFGDGQTSSGSSTTSRSYTQPGTYTVTLIVSDSSGDVAETTQPIQVEAPTAAFNPTEATVLAGSNVTFDGTPSTSPSGITSYAWNFGDGNTSTGAQPTHRYFEVGTFAVTLTVTDNSGNTSTITHPITVIAPPPIQTLIMTPVAAPTIVTWQPVSTTGRGLVNIGKRLFCPGPGPRCTATIAVTSASLARGARQSPARRKLRSRANVVGARTLEIAPDSSAELEFKLSKPALKALQIHRHLSIQVKLIVARGKQSTTSVLSLTLYEPRLTANAG